MLSGIEQAVVPSIHTRQEVGLHLMQKTAIPKRTASDPLHVALPHVNKLVKFVRCIDLESDLLIS